MYGMRKLCSGSLYVLISCVLNANAQFPRQCTTEQAISTRECCPRVRDNLEVSSKCGEHLGYGMCSDIQISTAALDGEMSLELIFDDRKNWPMKFYDKACRCNGNFDGVDCSRCKPGYAGTSCENRKSLAVRQDIHQWSKKKISEFMNYLNKSKYTVSEEYVILTTSYDRILSGVPPTFANISVYDLFVWMHYYASRDNVIPDDTDATLVSFKEEQNYAHNLLRELDLREKKLEISNIQDYAHEGPAFLPWHRYFLLKWEDEFRRTIVKNQHFTIPYWDWRNGQTCDVCTDEMFGAKREYQPRLISDNSPFSKWQIICTKNGDEDYLLSGKQCDGSPEGPLIRNYGEYDVQLSSGLPTSQDVISTMQMTSYEEYPYNKYANNSFRNVMEGFADPHDGEYLEKFSTMHNAVHLYMNGTMSEVGSSANDPIFIVHHAFVDSIYEKWLQKQSPQNVYMNSESHFTNLTVGHHPQDFMVPFFPLVRQREGFRSAKELGYTYEETESFLGSGLGRLEDETSAEDSYNGNTYQTNVSDDIYSSHWTADDYNDSNDYPTEAHFEALMDAMPPESKGEKKSGISVIRLFSKHKKYLRNVPIPKSSNHESGEAGVILHNHQQGRVFFRSIFMDERADVRKIDTFWDQIISSMYYPKEYFANLSVTEQILLLFLTGIILLCFVTSITMCCRYRRNQRIPSKISTKGSRCGKMSCFRNKSYPYDEEEKQALLETSCDGKIKKKTVTGNCYSFQDGKVPFNEI